MVEVVVVGKVVVVVVVGKVVEIDCEKPMKLETSPKVTKSKRSLHWCRSISKKISVQVLLQYQSKSYYIIGQEVYYSIGQFYYIIGQLLHYRAFITLSVGTCHLMTLNLLNGNMKFQLF